jgi:hypothetical protein
MMTGQRLCLPRFSTPRNLDRETLGPQIGEVARRLGFELMPWQQEVVDVGFEVDEDGRLVYSEVNVAVPRQSGKTALTFARMVWRATVAARMWGPQRVAYTAQTHKMARRKLERDFYDLLKGSRNFREVVNQKRLPTRPNEFRLSLNNGSEHVRFGTNSYLGIDAPSRSAGHGDSLDEGTIDEAFAHQEDDVEQAMLPAQATRFNPQIWVQSTAGDEKSFYWYRKILAGRAQPVGGEVAFFEWSIPDDADIDDPEVWWEHHPALGHTITEKFLRAQLDKARRSYEGEGLWRRAYGNQWVKIPQLEELFRLESVWPDHAWDACCHPEAASDVGTVFAVDVHPDRMSAAIGASDAAGRVELLEHRAGVGWVVDRATELVMAYKAKVAIQSTGAAGALIPDLERAGVQVVPITATDIKSACGKFYDDVCARSPFIRTDTRLNGAAAVAVKKPSGDAWVFDRRAGADISPLYAVVLARWVAYGGAAPPLVAWR